MCGIAGIFNTQGTNVTVDVLKNMMGRIRYRGPDESGMYIDEYAGIGNLRLSIIDLSTGQQPISNNDNSLWIVYNGEVFNYIELRQTLLKKGVNFKTDSDTEVILKCYEVYGEDCLKYLNGQFAFAIWNSEKKELFMARDRLGIRPLFYTQNKNTFVFASEMKSILEHPSVEPKLDTQALMQVFTFWTTLSPKTCFTGISELPPGHYLKVNHNGISINKYWSLDFSNDYDYQKGDINKASEAFEELFEDSVRLRLRADVPVAAYLSGGIDSSATTYFIKKVAKDLLQTFSIGFVEKDFDETIYQQEVSEYLKTQHTGFKCTNQEIAESFSDVVWHTEIPVLRTAPTPMYLLSKKVRENNIKVVITGEGADEMLGGYNIFKEMYIRRFWSRQPDSILRPLLLKKLYPYIPSLQSQNGKMLKFFFGYKLGDVDLPYYSHILRWNNSSKIAGYLNKDILSVNSGYDPILDFAGSLDLLHINKWHDLAKAQWLESTIFMSGYLLSSQGDRMAMANSVEGRYPFLDHRVVEFTTRLHPDLKLNGLNEKYLLKHTMQGRIPDSVLKRSKQAYRAPISASFLGKGAPEYISELLGKDKIVEYGLFDNNKVDVLLKKLKNLQQTELDNMALAAILSTQLLYHKFIKGYSPAQNELNDCRILSNSDVLK
ncbi:MAG: asparagine synthase (glutamine-hydrolyzing) [Bacteroidales bacterium]|nr:asparagine synthase (glutamine-hydrolyzing) [Bacteroidales bacterium]